MVIDHETRLAIGKRIHERTVTIEQAMAEYGMTRSMAYTCLALYRKSIGFVSPAMRAARKTRKADISPAIAAYAVTRMLDTPMPTIPHDTEERMYKLEQELEAALDEVRVLQKIVIALGRAL